MDSHMLKIEPRAEVVSEGHTEPLVLITRRTTFAAAHVLKREEWTAEENRRVFGACTGEHGHNYVLEVSVGGQLDPATGMVINLKDLDRIVRTEIISQVDHRHLNRDVEFLAGVIPTAENLATAFFNRLRDSFGPGGLRRLKLIETENNSVEVSVS